MYASDKSDIEAKVTHNNPFEKLVRQNISSMNHLCKYILNFESIDDAMDIF
jgi:hypothetical protein